MYGDKHDIIFFYIIKSKFKKLFFFQQCSKQVGSGDSQRLYYNKNKNSNDDNDNYKNKDNNNKDLNNNDNNKN